MVENSCFNQIKRYRKKRQVRFTKADQVKCEFIVIPDVSHQVALFLRNDDFHISARFFGYMSSIIGNFLTCSKNNRQSFSRLSRAQKKKSQSIIDNNLNDSRNCAIMLLLWSTVRLYWKICQPFLPNRNSTWCYCEYQRSKKTTYSFIYLEIAMHFHQHIQDSLLET